jgi:hypothetical protein
MRYNNHFCDSKCFFQWKQICHCSGFPMSYVLLSLLNKQKSWTEDDLNLSPGSLEVHTNMARLLMVVIIVHS